ncbi:hypothetical protein BDV96DRAFT_694522 [Lophiotrema nucula]|uniref:F-box domain-containing protein n=1 Tax=Lophiotrema nucula TaxID=690887 RepID=A0A6A5YFM8_9PLEO|nr:hypothetical protein BDV96DRAFT_694522 [Lophiotrema nucula]
MPIEPEAMVIPPAALARPLLNPGASVFIPNSQIIQSRNSSMNKLSQALKPQNRQEGLFKHCCLDTGRVSLSKPATATLGVLDKLAVELQYEVLGQLDIQSVFDFRRVNQKARGLVDGLVEYQKILENASDAFRMALSIKVADKISIRELFTKLCQRECDYCNKPAAFIDLFSMKRRCLDLGGYCQKLTSPMNFRQILRNTLLRYSEVEQVPAFLAIPEQEGVPLFNPFRSVTTYRDTFYDGEVIFSLARKKARYITGFPSFPYDTHLESQSKMTVTVAPWLDSTSTAAECPMFCQICWDSCRFRRGVHATYWRGYRPETSRPELGCSLYTTAEWKQHIEKKHNGKVVCPSIFA